ncbi:hypothetical protein [Chryseobacterium lathyri]|jgi:hypothetical protein|uniref:Uncharacterized protein n=1 Tax=Chryseobacterium lathyri TaxID=395933 RepID=A0A511YF91_9FLAO|nr:hypothetical protein [Chryseobacterium lathyri]GEN73836.1 hypothetical protein CLA01_39080 [Chryseobacterium lathyri]
MNNQLRIIEDNAVANINHHIYNNPIFNIKNKNKTLYIENDNYKYRIEKMSDITPILVVIQDNKEYKFNGYSSNRNYSIIAVKLLNEIDKKTIKDF